MPLDKQTQEEIRAIVASEIQDVLRGEMARWWAESVVALSKGTLKAPGNADVHEPQMGSGPHQQQSQGGASGAALAGGMEGRGGSSAATLWGIAPASDAAPASGRSGTGGAATREVTGSSSSGRREHIRRRRAFDAGYLARIADSLERAQADVLREQQSSIDQLRTMLEEVAETAEKLHDVLRATTVQSGHEAREGRRR